MGKKTQLDLAIEKVDAELSVLEQVKAKLLEQKARAPKRASRARRPAAAEGSSLPLAAKD